MERDKLMLLAGICIGAGAMALLDPGRGGRRRAWIRNKMAHGERLAARVADKKFRHMRNEAYGAFAERRARMAGDFVPDEVLEERVKAQIGHVLSHQSVDVQARDGHVIIKGSVLRGERQKLADRLNVTRGVCSYDLLVREHDADEGLPSLQGVSRPRQPAIS
jgi:hypothetical protein